MAAPTEIRGYSTNAKWTMNQKLSDDSDKILAAQGVGYLKRKAISMTTVTVVNKASTENGVTVVKSSSFASGIPGAEEELYCDATARESNHSVYGKIITTVKPTVPAEIDDAYLKTGYLPESMDDEGRLMYIESSSDQAAGNKYAWTAALTSGFQDVDIGGKLEKRWCRLNHFKTADGKDYKVRLVYDFVSY